MYKLKNDDSSLRSVSVITFLTYAARGLTVPFISLYLVAVGFSGIQIGLVLSASAAMRLIIPPVLSAIADRLGKHRQLYYGLVTGNALATFGLVVSAFSKSALGATVVIRDSLDSPSASLLSQLTITKLKQQRRDNYGQLRAWGSLGWGITTMMSGFLFGLGGYATLFMVAALLNFGSLYFSQALPRRTTDVNPDEKVKNTTETPMKRQRAFTILMVSWFFFHVGMSAVSTFVYVYFQQDLGISNTDGGCIGFGGSIV
ncbi:MAG: MFS transporter [Anaerolineae bacterium]|nr:MFS transporter [Anaerolineae bacterium]